MNFSVILFSQSWRTTLLGPPVRLGLGLQSFASAMLNKHVVEHHVEHRLAKVLDNYLLAFSPTLLLEYAVVWRLSTTIVFNI